ncbi:cbb3-type cytochrome c oxidase subunit III [Chryseobacterium sp. 52]|nr:cbb3-type cytochrome c oxidase subunit III [Chryseobacterium sp. 52]
MSSAALLTACDSRTYEEISDNTPITVLVKYNAEVKTIVDNNCMNCHGAGSFKPLVTYTDVKSNIDGIIDRIQRGNGDPQKMPQGGSLSQTQINTFIKWKADGLTEN